MSEQSLPPIYPTFSDRKATETFSQTFSSSETTDGSPNVENPSIEELEHRLAQRRLEFLKKFGATANEAALPKLLEDTETETATETQESVVPKEEDRIIQKRSAAVGGDIEWKVLSVGENDLGRTRVRLEEITHRPNPRRTSMGLEDLDAAPTEEGKAWNWISGDLD